MGEESCFTENSGRGAEATQKEIHFCRLSTARTAKAPFPLMRKDWQELLQEIKTPKATGELRGAMETQILSSNWELVRTSSTTMVTPPWLAL